MKWIRGVTWQTKTALMVISMINNSQARDIKMALSVAAPISEFSW